MNLRTRLSSLGRRTGGRQSITYHRQQFETQIDNNRYGIRLRLRLDQALQPGKAQRDKVKNQYLSRMARVVSVAESTAILTTYPDRSFFTLKIKL